MNQVHLFEEEFQVLENTLITLPSYHAIVLDCGIAGMVKYYVLGDIVYYEDHLYADNTVLEQKYHGDPNDLHAEVYQKFALVNKLYA